VITVREAFNACTDLTIFQPSYGIRSDIPKTADHDDDQILPTVALLSIKGEHVEMTIAQGTFPFQGEEAISGVLSIVGFLNPSHINTPTT
jgi:hypothetical protein